MDGRFILDVGVLQPEGHIGAFIFYGVLYMPVGNEDSNLNKSAPFACNTNT